MREFTPTKETQVKVLQQDLDEAMLMLMQANAGKNRRELQLERLSWQIETLRDFLSFPGANDTDRVKHAVSTLERMLQEARQR